MAGVGLGRENAGHLQSKQEVNSRRAGGLRYSGVLPLGRMLSVSGLEDVSALLLSAEPCAFALHVTEAVGQWLSTGFRVRET